MTYEIRTVILNSKGGVHFLKDKSSYEARTFRFPPDVLRQMDEYSETTGISKTAIVEKALREYLIRNFLDNSTSGTDTCVGENGKI